MFLGESACVAEVKIEIVFSSLTKIPLLFHCDMLRLICISISLIF